MAAREVIRAGPYSLVPQLDALPVAFWKLPQRWLAAIAGDRRNRQSTRDLAAKILTAKSGAIVRSQRLYGEVLAGVKALDPGYHP